MNFPHPPSSVVGRLASVGEALTFAHHKLVQTDSPALTAQVLLAHVTGLTRTQVLARLEQPLSEAQQAQYAGLLARAAEGEPLAYLTGEREFCGLLFWVDHHVLVPRPETELLVELGAAARPRRILDVGTGSGCLAIALAVRRPQAMVMAVDIAPEALALARRNAARHGVERRLTFIKSDLLSAWLPSSDPFATNLPVARPPAFDLIVANLPYIDSDELRGLAVARHEPALALDGGPDGLKLIERLLRQALRFLAPHGLLLLEIGAAQSAPAVVLARAAFPHASVTVHQDLAGLDRVVALRLGQA